MKLKKNGGHFKPENTVDTWTEVSFFKRAKALIKIYFRIKQSQSKYMLNTLFSFIFFKVKV